VLSELKPFFAPNRRSPPPRKAFLKKLCPPLELDSHRRKSAPWSIAGRKFLFGLDPKLFGQARGSGLLRNRPGTLPPFFRSVCGCGGQKAFSSTRFSTYPVE